MITPSLQRRHSFGINGSIGSQKEIGRAQLIESSNVHSFVYFKSWWLDWLYKVNVIQPEGAIATISLVNVSEAQLRSTTSSDLTLKFNHYKYRSVEDNVKKTAANENRIVPTADHNAVFDSSAARFAPLVHKRLKTRASLVYHG
jgi:hypothetical protein